MTRLDSRGALVLASLTMLSRGRRSISPGHELVIIPNAHVLQRV